MASGRVPACTQAGSFTPVAFRGILLGTCPETFPTSGSRGSAALCVARRGPKAHSVAVYNAWVTWTVLYSGMVVSASMHTLAGRRADKLVASPPSGFAGSASGHARQLPPRPLLEDPLPSVCCAAQANLRSSFCQASHCAHGASALRPSVPQHHLVLREVGVTEQVLGQLGG